MKVLLLKDAKEEDGGQDPYVRVSVLVGCDGLTMKLGVGGGSPETEELAQNNH